MTNKKKTKNKTQDILSALFITLIFIAVISIIFIKLANITYQIEKTAQETKAIKEKKETEQIINVETDNKKENSKEQANKRAKIEPEVTEEYIPIKFLWTGNDNGYWIKTNEEDKEWYSIEEGIYPTYAYNPQITEMTFRINGNYDSYDVITDWKDEFYIWIPKLEGEEYNKSLFLEKEKGTLLLYNNGWENPFNRTYNGREKINMLPEKMQEKLLRTYKNYTDNMQNQNIQNEEVENQETENQE